MIMYRARVDAVNGTKVRAGGKELTCIGNKPVKVGDTVWTDGSCVYGNEQTPQQPHVITPKEDLGIPLYSLPFTNGTAKNGYVGYYKLKDNSFEFFHSDTKYHRITNNKRMIFENRSVYALNIDANNDFYSLSKKGSTSITKELQFDLAKNNKIFKSIKLSDFIPNNFYVNSIHAFIEDEDHWQLILYLVEHYGDVEDTFNSVVIIDNNGVIRNTTSTKLTIPMNDGFYYETAGPQLLPDRTVWIFTDLFNKVAGFNNAVIYSPTGKIIVNFPDCAFPCCLSACEISKNIFLIGVNNYAFSLYNTQGDHQANGLYICNNGNLKKLSVKVIKDNGIPYEISRLNLTNQCLRPMKNYKNWWNKIQDFTSEN